LDETKLSDVITDARRVCAEDGLYLDGYCRNPRCWRRWNRIQAERPEDGPRKPTRLRCLVCRKPLVIHYVRAKGFKWTGTAVCDVPLAHNVSLYHGTWAEATELLKQLGPEAY
jgi:hypothetical protein